MKELSEHKTSSLVQKKGASKLIVIQNIHNFPTSDRWVCSMI